MSVNIARSSPVEPDKNDRLILSDTQWSALRPMLIDIIGRRGDDETPQEFNARLDAAAWDLLDLSLTDHVAAWHHDNTLERINKRQAERRRANRDRAHAAGEAARAAMTTTKDPEPVEEPTP